MDVYMMEGFVSVLGNWLYVEFVECGYILDCLDWGDVVVFLLIQMYYKIGVFWDMVDVIWCVYVVGVFVIWDFSYFVGVLLVELDVCKVDFVVGCGYKYFNGGFGVLVFIYVVQCYQGQVMLVLFGWMGYVVFFVFDDQYDVGWGIDCFLCGMFGIFGMCVFEVGLDIFQEVDMVVVCKKFQ